MYLGKGMWTMLAPLAVMEVGAAYVPIDADRPAEWVRHIIADSGADAVIVGTPSETDLGCTEISLDSIADGVPSAVSVGPGDAAAVIYTSGSTGRPKGSLLTHRGIENLIEWQAEYVGLRGDDVFGMYPSFGFCSHIDAMFSCMIAGSAVDIIPEEVRLDLDLLRDYVRDRGITLMKMAASVGRLFVPMAEGTGLRLIFLGGEKLGPFDAPSRLTVVDGYGPTENTVQTACADVADKRYAESVGTPLPNVGVYILDGQLRRLPVGAVGHLHVSGRQVSPGYTDGDRSAYHDNPYSDLEEHGTLYDTGDLARFLPDGTVGIIGRDDGQVKVRGNRVELTEIEACIRGYPGVEDVVVRPAVSVGESGELCAYVVSPSDVPASDIQWFVRERKPDYMVPAFVVFLDRIPLTVNGKVDKNALPRPDPSSLAAGYEPPRNGTERIICGAFAEALGTDRVGIHDDFIRLGGDSLKGMKAVSVCRKNGLILSVPDILALRTPESLALRRNIQIENVFTTETGCPVAGG